MKRPMLLLVFALFAAGLAVQQSARKTDTRNDGLAGTVKSSATDTVTPAEEFGEWDQ